MWTCTLSMAACVSFVRRPDLRNGRHMSGINATRKQHRSRLTSKRWRSAGQPETNRSARGLRIYRLTLLADLQLPIFDQRRTHASHQLHHGAELFTGQHTCHVGRTDGLLRTTPSQQAADGSAGPLLVLEAARALPPRRAALSEGELGILDAGTGSPLCILILAT